MSDTTHGEQPLTIYDVITDQRRPATQADIDLMSRRLGELGIFWAKVRDLVKTTQAEIAS